MSYIVCVVVFCLLTYLFSMEGFFLRHAHQGGNSCYLKSQAALKPVLLKHFWSTYFWCKMHELFLHLTVGVLKQNDKTFYQPLPCRMHESLWKTWFNNFPGSVVFCIPIVVYYTAIFSFPLQTPYFWTTTNTYHGYLASLTEPIISINLF